MKGTIITVLFFVVGCMLSLYELTPVFLLEYDYSTYALYALMALVGVSLGMDEASINILKKVNVGLFLVPVSIGLGSILGSGLAYWFIGESFTEGMAVGAGFGTIVCLVLSSQIHMILF